MYQIYLRPDIFRPPRYAKIPQHRTKRLHACIFQFARGVCTNDFYSLTYHVRSRKDRWCFALRALGATVKLLKIRFQLGHTGPAIHVARVFHVTDFYEGLHSRTAEPAIYVLSSSGAQIDRPPIYNHIWPGQPDSQTSYLDLYLARIAA